MFESMTRDTGVAAAKVSPPIAAVTAKASGWLTDVPVSDLVLWLTAIYTALMIAHLLWKWGREMLRVWRIRV